ncbi:probable glycosyltransferase STELLO1 [Haliotis rubra]|uniref:probable glycosyltransferase STELLO1 n=1 Tax=Haliotis rubra TaxID=36100 RepID=UPI001EE60F16|nr:probable glycosyltransferase STELLO1 [Haliotis rubra]
MKYNEEDNRRLPDSGRILNGKFSDKWIVTTATAAPNDNVKFLAQIPGWKVVVVGDRKSPSQWSHKGCVYLGPKDQTLLGFSTAPHLPRDSYARKNIGYLYAIAHGAKVIYETDDNHRPTGNLTEFILKPNTTGLRYGGINMFNPYNHFGQPTVWPRGYPLSSVGDNASLSYVLDDWTTPSIQQGLVNGSPEVDAIVQLTRTRKHLAPNITFDVIAPPAFVPSGVFSTLNSYNTLFTYNAFWALLIPTTIPSFVSDIWRGYWAQRLLWEMGGSIGFFPPNSFQEHNNETNLADANLEHEMYFKSEKLLEFLRNWNCNPRNSFFDCVIALSDDMARQKFWRKADAEIIRHWLQDLRTMGYEEPKRIPYSKRKQHTHTRHRKRRKSSPTNVQFVPEVQVPPGVDATASSELLHHYLANVNQICPRLDIRPPRGTHTTFSSIVLIIVLKEPGHYGNVRTYEALYGFQFTHIVYCGAKFNKIYKTPTLKVTTVEVDVHKGTFAQNCLIKTMEMNYGAGGYLLVSEDTLLHVWTLGVLPQDRIWFIKPVSQDTSRSPRYKYQSRINARSFMKAMIELEQTNKTMYTAFKRRLGDNRNHARDDTYISQVSDIVYVPQRYKLEFMFLSNLLTRNGLPVEITIPTVISGIEDQRNVYYLDGRHVTRAQGSALQQQFHKNFNYIHPVQIGQVMKTAEGVEFFCKTFIPLALGS